MTAPGKIVDAFAEWDDPHGFRVFLVRETDGELDEGSPMESVFLGDSIEVRLYRAAFAKCFKDLGNMTVDDRVLTFERKAPAERVAKAVRAELKRIGAGEPAMTDHEFGMAVQLAKVLMPKGRRR